MRLLRQLVLSWTWSVIALALATAVGCRREPEPQQTRPPLPEPVVPTAAAGGAPAAAAPPWGTELPDQAVPAKQGDQVWATISDGETGLVRVGVFTVEAVDGSCATLITKMGKKSRDVPGALIHPLGDPKRLGVGEVALCYSWTTPGMLARVVKIRGRHILVQHDWAGETKQTVVEHAEPLVTDLAPLAFVGYPKFGGMSKGMVIALSDDRAWLRTGSGHVEVHPRTELSALHIRSKPYRVGDAVRAYSWTGGFERGTITEVAEPRLRYAVQLEGDRAPHTYFFADLVPAP